MRLIRNNVERITESEEQIALLKAQGFKPLQNGGVKADIDKKVNISDMSVAQLKALAKEKGIEGASALTKEELLQVLKDVI